MCSVPTCVQSCCKHFGYLVTCAHRLFTAACCVCRMVLWQQDAASKLAIFAPSLSSVGSPFKLTKAYWRLDIKDQLPQLVVFADQAILFSLVVLGSTQYLADKAKQSPTNRKASGCLRLGAVMSWTTQGTLFPGFLESLFNFRTTWCRPTKTFSSLNVTRPGTLLEMSCTQPLRTPSST